MLTGNSFCTSISKEEYEALVDGQIEDTMLTDTSDYKTLQHTANENFRIRAFHIAHRLGGHKVFGPGQWSVRKEEADETCYHLTYTKQGEVNEKT